MAEDSEKSISITNVSPQEVEAHPLFRPIVAAIIAELDDYIDPPEVSGLMVMPDDRRYLAHRAARRVVLQLMRKDHEKMVYFFIEPTADGKRVTGPHFVVPSVAG